MTGLYYRWNRITDELTPHNDYREAWPDDPHDRRIAFDTVWSRRHWWERRRQISISTVFLVIDHSYSGSPPLLFETMVFGGDLDGQQERYATAAQARGGHARWVRAVRLGRVPDE